MAMIGRLKPGVSAAAAAGEDPDHRHAAHARAHATQFVRRVRQAARRPCQRPDAAGALGARGGAVGVVMLIVVVREPVKPAPRAQRIAAEGNRDPHGVGADAGASSHRCSPKGSVVCSGAVRLLLAIGGTRALASLDAVSVRFSRASTPTMTTLGFTLAVAIVTGIVFGLPQRCRRRKRDCNNALKDSSADRRAAAPGYGARSSFQIALRACAGRGRLLIEASLGARRGPRIHPVTRGHDSRGSGLVVLDA